MQNIVDELSKQLQAYNIQIDELVIESDPYGYLCIRIQYETSIEESSYRQRNAQLMTIIKHATPCFLSGDHALQRLMVQELINDDKVAIEPIGFNKDDLIEWYSGRFDEKTLLSHAIGYWHQS